MKTLPALLLGMLLAYSFAGHSQALAPAPVAPRVFTHADTLEGLHRVFLKNRRRGRVMTGLAPIAVGTTLYGWSQISTGSVNLMTSSQPDYASTSAIVMAFAGGIGSVLLVICGPDSWLGNSKEAEQKMLLLYEQRRPLPKHIQRQLHNRLKQLLD